MWFESLLERGLIPDFLLRFGVRASITASTAQWRRASTEMEGRKSALVERLSESAIASYTQSANQQHYEISSDFFELVLGPWRKYSCCLWPEGTTTLAQAEQAMLQMTCQRAQVHDGMRILDLGCGWGSLALWLAQNYPNCQITALSNSHSQREFIQRKALAKGLANLELFTGDVANIQLSERFDRVISIEMFEHMSNYRQLLAKISQWLTPAGKLFVHHFSHRKFAYKFDPRDPKNFMARTYFAGGTMPSHDLLFYFQDNLAVVKDWQVSGLHYARTLRAWLENLDANRQQILQIFSAANQARTAKEWLIYWRNFFIICEETFAINHGQEYLVSHILMEQN